MAKKQVQTLALEGMTLTYLRDRLGKDSAIFEDANGKLQRGKKVTLTGIHAVYASAFLLEHPMPENYRVIGLATTMTHNIKRKKDAAEGTGWTWLNLNGRVSEENFQKLVKLGFKLSKNKSDEIKGEYAYYAQTEIAEAKIRKAIKL